MIKYDPFWETLKRKKITTYFLINKEKVSSSTIARLRNNEPITTTTMNDLCRILNCRVEDIAVYVPCKYEQRL